MSVANLDSARVLKSIHADILVGGPFDGRNCFESSLGLQVVSVDNFRPMIRLTEGMTTSVYEWSAREKRYQCVAAWMNEIQVDQNPVFATPFFFAVTLWFAAVAFGSQAWQSVIKFF